MELGIIWIFFIIVTTIVAGQKNRGEIRWLLISSFFGFLALIVVLILPKIEKETKKDKNSSVETISKETSRELDEFFNPTPLSVPEDTTDKLIKLSEMEAIMDILSIIIIAIRR